MKRICETPRYVVCEEDGRLVGYEKKHRVLKDDDTVLVYELKEDDITKSILDAMHLIGAEEVIAPGDKVAIKVNIGGGIDGVPSSYTEPLIVEGIAKAVRSLGAEPFVCEADMRTISMTEKKLRKRGYYEILQRNKIPFVNLSTGPIVEFHPLDLDFPLPLPWCLLDPSVKIISAPMPKHHWECGITVSQKNMYGAIAERRKSIYHRKYELIDKVVAAAARAMTPDLNIVAATKLGAGLGPHFCIPIRFNRIVVAKDMLRCDKFVSEILGYPYELVKYAMINAQGEEVTYRLHEKSVGVEEETLKKIWKYRIPPERVRMWKRVLWLQYFIPHWFQYAIIPKFEFIGTAINKMFYETRGDR